MLIPLLPLLSSTCLAMPAVSIAMRREGAMLGVVLRMLFPCEGMRKCEEGKGEGTRVVTLHATVRERVVSVTLEYVRSVLNTYLMSGLS